ncbi:hypothetical protein HDV00_010053 [Rhizophlyctis rosea]|nr:hypothetical protein HDV00_010053 [Rhizophlyctis rosea]
MSLVLPSICVALPSHFDIGDLQAWALDSFAEHFTGSWWDGTCLKLHFDADDSLEDFAALLKYRKIQFELLTPKSLGKQVETYPIKPQHDIFILRQRGLTKTVVRKFIADPNKLAGCDNTVNGFILAFDDAEDAESCLKELRRTSNLFAHFWPIRPFDDERKHPNGQAKDPNRTTLYIPKPLPDMNVQIAVLRTLPGFLGINLHSTPASTQSVIEAYDGVKDAEIEDDGHRLRVKFETALQAAAAMKNMRCLDFLDLQFEPEEEEEEENEDDESIVEAQGASLQASSMVRNNVTTELQTSQPDSSMDTAVVVRLRNLHLSPNTGQNFRLGLQSSLIGLLDTIQVPSTSLTNSTDLYLLFSSHQYLINAMRVLSLLSTVFDTAQFLSTTDDTERAVVEQWSEHRVAFDMCVFRGGEVIARDMRLEDMTAGLNDGEGKEESETHEEIDVAERTTQSVENDVRPEMSRPSGKTAEKGVDVHTDVKGKETQTPGNEGDVGAGRILNEPQSAKGRPVWSWPPKPGPKLQ